MRPNGAPGPVLRPLGGPRRGLSGIIRRFLERLSEKGLKYTRWWVPDVAIGRTKAFFLAPFAASQVPVWSLSRIFRQSLEGLFSEVELPLNGFLRGSLRASITKQRQKYAVWVMRYDDRSWYGASQQERSEDQHRVFSEGRHPLGCGEPVVQPATAYIP